MCELIINNSYSKLEGDFPQVIVKTVKDSLTYIDSSISQEIKFTFGKMKFARTSGNQKLFSACKKRIAILSRQEIVCWFRNNTFPTGHLNIVQDILKVLKFDYKTVDNRTIEEPDQILRWHNKPFEPRYYQKEMIELGLRENRGVFESAVGTGKSLVMGYLIKELSSTSLIIVPSRGLLEQLHQDLCLWFGPKNVDTISTTKVRNQKKQLKPIRVSTVQTIASLQKSGELDLLVGDVKALFVDEIHHAGSKTYTDLLSAIDHIYYRFGFSATFMRNDSKQLDMYGFLSNTIYNYPAHKAISEGYLTPTRYHSCDIIGRAHKKYAKEYDLNYCGRDLQKYILDIINDNTGQILILVDRKEKAGDKIRDFLWCHGVKATFINGDDSKENIYNAIADFNEKKIRILIGSKVIGEGIDVRTTDHLVLANGGKSEVQLVQGIGRAVRLSEGKEIAHIHDFRFTNTNYLEKHYNKRVGIYERVFK